MSKFITRIPVDIEAVKKLLPPGAYFHGVQAGLGFESIDLVWEHDQLKTPWDYAIDYPSTMLGGNAVPKGVMDLREGTIGLPDNRTTGPLTAPEHPTPNIQRPAAKAKPPAAKPARAKPDPTAKRKAITPKGKASVKQRL